MLLSNLETIVEVKPNPKVYATQQDSCNPTSELLTKFSSWHRLKTAVAWILRFRKYLLTRTRDMKPLGVADLRLAEEAVIRYVQLPFAVNSRMKQLVRLSPFHDNGGLLRVGGRAANSPVSFAARHPLLLPSSHHVTELIVRHYHEINGHSGPERTLADIRQVFWIIKGRAAVKRVLSRCVTCRKLKARAETQMMGNLPESRVTPNEPPFSRVGIDYFGPFFVKRGRSELKRYGCIFTCLSTRAVHLEVSHSLDTDSFINALQRFIARRGEPTEIRSDNGTNFVGAQLELKRSIQEWNQNQINSFLLRKEITWIFNPPGASHMGGVWERLIRSIRSVLNSLLGLQRLDDEGLSTLMTVVESIVNNRPITKLSDDPNDDSPLTPNHLLLQRPGSILPPGKFVDKDMYRRRWRQVQYQADIFWKRWVHEYLPTLQERQKWFFPCRNLVKGDLVLIKDDNMARNLWPLGLIVDTFPGSDGLVRSVIVKTKGGIYERPTTKICLLEGCVQ